jgi:hypothetical protein
VSNSDFTDLFARAIADPSKILPRVEGESTARWGARAVEATMEAADKEFIDGQVAQANILGWNMNAGVTDLQVSMALETAAGLVTAAKTFLTATGAENYVEQHVHDRETGERYTLTIQRPGKKTPHELRRQAEFELDERLTQVNRVVTVVNTWQRWREQADDGAPFAELYDQVLAALGGQDDVDNRPSDQAGGA